MSGNSKKGFPGGPSFDYMTRDEIDEYFSVDLKFDFERTKYEPPYPLTAGEARLLYSNHTGAVPLPLELADVEKISAVERVRKEMWSKPPNPPDVLLHHDSGPPHAPLEGGLVAVKTGSPEEIKEYLDGLESHDRLFVRMTEEGVIVTLREYLSRLEKKKEQ